MAGGCWEPWGPWDSWGTLGALRTRCPRVPPVPWCQQWVPQGGERPGAGALPDGAEPLGRHGAGLRHEGVRVVSGAGAAARPALPARRPAQPRLHAPARLLPGHPERQVGGDRVGTAGWGQGGEGRWAGAGEWAQVGGTEWVGPGLTTPLCDKRVGAVVATPLCVEWVGLLWPRSIQGGVTFVGEEPMGIPPCRVGVAPSRGRGQVLIDRSVAAGTAACGSPGRPSGHRTPRRTQRGTRVSCPRCPPRWRPRSPPRRRQPAGGCRGPLGGPASPCAPSCGASACWRPPSPPSCWGSPWPGR